ncbi:MAG TPA: Nif11-like leader peptide family natural product precursor [Candidatus Wallbacteria bacterium]|mgnify:CR=1 FL=1|nr:Nif11-like leader peptide family natural product precursor [Candidatus Wallbacteria bacterium]
MSKDNVKQMFMKIEKDAQLKNKFAQLMKTNKNQTETVMVEKLIEFGKSAGFAFSKDDLMAARAELVDKANSNKELSDGDLSKVAGGGASKGNEIALSVLTLGLSCIHEIFGRCEKVNLDLP